MSRNYGAGSRDMARAGKMILSQAAMSGSISFSAAATYAMRWGQFAKWVKLQGINRMEKIDRSLLMEYGITQDTKCERGDMSPATAQNNISAVNVVMHMARGDRDIWVSPTKDCGIPERDGICRESKATSHDVHEAAKQVVSDRLATQLDLQRELGLRFKESCLIDARSALREIAETGVITIEDGTKGGRPRELEPSRDAIQALERAAEIQSEDRSLIPGHQTFIQYAREAYREIALTDINFHGERHAYAHLRYEQEIEERYGLAVPCPVAAGIAHGSAHYEYMAKMLGISASEARNVDRDVRQVIAEELGHGRWGITNAYLG